MGIKFRCPACEKKLHVKSFLAGKRGVCPKCGAKVRIPLASVGTSPAGSLEDAVPLEEAQSAAVDDAAVLEGVASAVASERVRAVSAAASDSHAASSGVRPSSVHDPIAEAPDAVWYVRPPTGGQFGPADATIMRRWLAEGRVGADALVWREGWPEWKSAGPVFPSFAGADFPDAATATVPPASEVHEAFAIAHPRPAAERVHARARTKPMGRHASIIGALVVLCVMLVVALIIVLRGQS